MDSAASPDFATPAGDSHRAISKAAPRPQIEGLESRCLLSVTINQFPVPTQPSVNEDIASGPDGNLWFTENLGNKIGQINPTTHAITEFPIPASDSGRRRDHGRARRQPLVHREVGQQDRSDQPDDTRDHRVPHPHERQRAPRNHGRARRQPLVHRGRKQQDRSRSTRRHTPSPSSRSRRPPASPAESRPGPTATSGSPSKSATRIGQINPTTDAITEFPTPRFGSSPDGITSGPDGNLWFTEGDANAIGRDQPDHSRRHRVPHPHRRQLTLRNHGRVRRQPLVHRGRAPATIGQINPTTDVITEFPIPTGGSIPNGITSGPDGNLWFTEAGEFGNDWPGCTVGGSQRPTWRSRSLPPALCSRGAP